MRKAASAGSAAQFGMPFQRAYTTPITHSSDHPVSRVARKPPDVFAIALILTFVLLATPSHAQDPPANLAKLVAHRESQTETERSEYTYRQGLTIDELDDHGGARGQYKETRDVIFSPQHDRTEQMIGNASNALKNLILTEEDFQDIRNIQPLVLTEDRLWNYETKFRGDETMDEVDCWVLQVRPRQILQGQRFFDGMIWVDKKEYNIVRMEGQAVPQIRTTKTENLFPRFTTIRKPLDGKHWFPVYTYADDTLHFRTGPQRIRLRIAYSNYKRFGAESTLIVK
jgi:hypothetical protein